MTQLEIDSQEQIAAAKIAAEAQAEKYRVDQSGELDEFKAGFEKDAEGNRVQKPGVDAVMMGLQALGELIAQGQQQMAQAQMATQASLEMIARVVSSDTELYKDPMTGAKRARKVVLNS
jgi:hypothetical protein